MEKIKELRDKTGAGIGDCKKALEEAGGDLEKAVEFLRKQGIAKAAKRGEREASEGIIMVEASADGKTGYILEANAETDFVVRNEQFKKAVDEAFALLKSLKTGSIEDLLAAKMGESTVKESFEFLSGVIGEKLGLKRCAIIESAGTVASYSHAGGRIGVLVALDKAGEAVLAGEIAMQIAAANPRYVLPEDVSAEEIAKEKEIYLEQLRKEGKPEAMLEKIVVGKLSRFYGEVCLLEQEFIKDDKKKVKDILGGIRVEKFIRYSL